MLYFLKLTTLCSIDKSNACFIICRMQAPAAIAAEESKKSMPAIAGQGAEFEEGSTESLAPPSLAPILFYGVQV